jgi:hypothetical protein
MPIVSTLQAILLSVLPVFTKPTGRVFLRLVVGWVLCPTRRTVTGMISFADPDGVRSHDTYHRFFRAAAWCLRPLFRTWAAVVVREFCPEGTLWLITDDTVHKKTGRKVAGAAWCRDAARSTGQRIVYVWGLKLVVLCLRVNPPWGGEPLALPIAFRVYRKDGPTLLDLVAEMMVELTAQFPDRSFVLTADGFYAPLAGRRPERTHLISRLRTDAAVYEMPPPRRPGQRGRPRKKGKRLPSPAQMAARVRKWKRVATHERGQARTRLVYTRRVLWYHVQPDRPVLLVISRDPTGREKDDFFFTTDLDMDPATVISEFANRWSVEDTFRNTKQFLGGEHPQSWKEPGPERAAGFAYFLYGLVWLWHIKYGHGSSPLVSTPWYPNKTTPSFKDALAALRTVLWRKRIYRTVGRRAQSRKFQALLIHALARAA